MTDKVNGLFSESCESPFGTIRVCCSQIGIRQVTLDSTEKSTGKSKITQGARKKLMVTRQLSGRAETVQKDRAGAAQEPGTELARIAITQLREYACGRRTRFSVPLDLQGTPFQLKVWNSLCGIPYGETRSYQDVAREVGNPRAARAVGMANHWNPVAIMVPCHRVISSDGSLGGYAGGLQKKVQMLQLEKTTRDRLKPRKKMGRRSGVSRLRKLTAYY